MRSLVTPALSLSLIVVLSLAAAPAMAAQGAWDPPITISTAGESGVNPQLVTDGTTITAVWQSYDGTFDRIQAASSTDDGFTWTTPVTLSDAGGTADSAQLVTDGTTITAAWHRFDGSDFRIQTASSTDGGATWSTPVTLSDPGEDATTAQLVTDGTAITATWHRFDGGNNRIQSASSTDGGATWTAPVTLSDAGGDASFPELVTDGTTITVAWHRDDGTDFRIQAASSTDGGATWTAPVTISDPGEDAAAAELVTDGSTITVAWTRSDGSNNRVQTASSTDGGTTWSTPFTLSDAGGDAFTPELATDGSTITAVWMRFDGSSYRIETSNSTDGGATWTTPVTLSDPSGDGASPQLVTDGATITVLWRFDDADSRIHTANSTDGGTTWSTLTALSNPGEEADNPRLVTDGTTITAIWDLDDDSDDTRIEVSSLSAFPDAGPGPAAGPELAESGPSESIGLTLLALALLAGGGILFGVRPRRPRVPRSSGDRTA